MSIQAISWAFEQTTRPRNKLVLIMLANAAPPEFKMFTEVPVALLGVRTGLKDYKLYEALSELEQQGFIGLIDDGDTFMFNLNMEAV